MSVEQRMSLSEVIEFLNSLGLSGNKVTVWLGVISIGGMIRRSHEGQTFTVSKIIGSRLYMVHLLDSSPIS